MLVLIPMGKRLLDHCFAHTLLHKVPGVSGSLELVSARLSQSVL